MEMRETGNGAVRSLPDGRHLAAVENSSCIMAECEPFDCDCLSGVEPIIDLTLSSEASDSETEISYLGCSGGKVKSEEEVDSCSEKEVDLSLTSEEIYSDDDGISSDPDEECFYDGDPCLPVYQWNKKNCHFNIEKIARILLCNGVSEDKICSKQPIRVCRNVSFVVNLLSLDEANDIRADENGVWNRKGSPVAYVSVHENTVTKRSKLKPLPNHFKLTRTYYKHSSSPDFNRIITMAYDYQGRLKDLAFVQYSFDNFEHSIEIKPHGNSKGKMPFTRCKPSTIKKLKASSKHQSPIVALREVENTMGGVMKARSLCDLPRNRRQVYNINSTVKRHTEATTSPLPSISSTDVLAQVMQKCKEASGSQAYIRSVEAAPEPMCVLATDQQLADLERFCTGDKFGIIGIDPTFNLGSFYVTPITYQNLLVETKKGNHPIVLGPVLIHQTKKFSSFHYFVSTLLRLNPKLVELKAFGTDGEGELIKALKLAFPNAVHLRCMNHLRQNVKDKLRNLKIPTSTQKEFLNDIFGSRTGSHFEAGLVDASSDDSFRTALENVQQKWNNLERGFIHPDSEPRFHSWFSTYKADEIVHCVLPSVRKKAGMNDSSLHFTTNCSESLNHVIKKQVDWKENKLPVLIEHLKCISDRYKEELEKAVVRRGEWCFTPDYSHLEVDEAMWFSSRMSSSSKEKHMKEVFICPVVSSRAPLSKSIPSQNEASTSSILQVSVEECGISSLSTPLLSDIWSKAERLVSMEGSILKIPWNKDSSARLVMSTSSDHPHVVKTNPKSKKQYICDEKCLMFKGNSICSHTVAASHVNGELNRFIEYYKQKKCGPNLTKIAAHGLPSGSGRKGGVPRKRKHVALPIETRSVRPCFSETSPSASSSQPTTLVPNVSVNGMYSQYSGQPTSSAVLGQQTMMASLHHTEGISSTNAAARNTSPSVEHYASQPSFQATNSNTSLCDGPTVLSRHTPLVPSSTINAAPSVAAGKGSSVSTSFGIVLGGNVNISSPSQSSVNSSTSRHTAEFPGPMSNIFSSVNGNIPNNPFVLKFKTNLIKICQSCRKNYDAPNDTMGLVVARAERRMVSNLATGTQFLGRESNSHYHAHMWCLKKASNSFQGSDLVIDEAVKERLTPFQKVYLISCLQVPNL